MTFSFAPYRPLIYTLIITRPLCIIMHLSNVFDYLLMCEICDIYIIIYSVDNGSCDNPVRWSEIILFELKHLYVVHFHAPLLHPVIIHYFGNELRGTYSISLWFDTLQWRHNGWDSVSNHQPHHCYPNVYSDKDQRKHQSSSSLAFVWGINRGFPAQMASNAENDSIWWRRHDMSSYSPRERLIRVWYSDTSTHEHDNVIKLNHFPRCWPFVQGIHRLSKQPRRWWFETPSCALWRHCSGTLLIPCK